jgi:hypothetical protein
MVGGIIPLRRATSSRYDGRLEQESALACASPFGANSGANFSVLLLGMLADRAAAPEGLRRRHAGAFSGLPRYLVT